MWAEDGEENFEQSGARDAYDLRSVRRMVYAMK